MPLSKKKTASKSGKAAASDATKKVSAVGPGRKPTEKTAVKKAAASSKSATVKSAGSKKSSAKLKKATASKKISSSQVDNKNQPSKTVAGNKSTQKSSAVKKSVTKKSADSPADESRSKGHERQVKADRKTGKAAVSKSEPASETIRSDARSENKSADRLPVASRKKNQESALSDSISQGLAKQGQKKRGWRDIEALTERARLKNLLSDIWHEDIDLDSDIFGETDQFSSYYTDKEEEIEVEDDEDEEWEEFEEDES